MTIAGAQLKGVALAEAYEMLKNTLDKMLEEGAL